MKEFLIQGKGFWNNMLPDPFVQGVEVSDIKSGYGYIEFKGTDKQLDKFLEHLYQDESSFKVIGIHESNN